MSAVPAKKCTGCGAGCCPCKGPPKPLIAESKMELRELDTAHVENIVHQLFSMEPYWEEGAAKTRARQDAEVGVTLNVERRNIDWLTYIPSSRDRAVQLPLFQSIRPGTTGTTVSQRGAPRFEWTPRMGASPMPVSSLGTQKGLGRLKTSSSDPWTLAGSCQWTVRCSGSRCTRPPARGSGWRTEGRRVSRRIRRHILVLRLGGI